MKTSKKNAPDATRRNVRASHKRDATQNTKISGLSRRLKKLEARVAILEANVLGDNLESLDS